MFKKFSIFLSFFLILLTSLECNNASNNQNFVKVEDFIEKGNTFCRQYDYKSAIEQYNLALQSNAKSAEAYYSRGKAYFFMGNYSMAVVDFNSATEIDPQYVDAYNYRGWAYLNNGAFDKAISDFTRLIELKPDAIVAYNGRGWAYMNKAQWEESSLLYLYQKFESETGLVQAYKGNAWHYVKQEQWQYSYRPELVTGVDRVPGVAEAECNIGFASFKKAQWDAAILDLESAYAIDPELNMSKWNVEWATGKREEWNLVLNDYGKIIEIITSASPEISISSPVSDLESWYDLAIEHYKKAIELSKDEMLVGKANDALIFMGTWRKEVGWQIIK